MDHIAILKDGPLDDILSGHKTIESRWSVHKSAPYGRINAGDVIFLKRTGRLVEARASVTDVKQFDELTLDTVNTIIKQHGPGINLDKTNYHLWWNAKKKYCVLIFLADVKRVTPFSIDKSGFGNMAAWMCLQNGIAAITQKP